jgi:DNA-binding CsgD family transcriptional regulator
LSYIIILELSPRTVQYYIENVKDRLGIITREELIQSGQLLKMSGLLDL